MAEKALLSSIFGRLTQKTLAKVCKQVYREEAPEFGILSNLIFNMVPVSHWKDARSDENPSMTSGFHESEENQFESSIQLRLNIIT